MLRPVFVVLGIVFALRLPAAQPVDVGLTRGAALISGSIVPAASPQAPTVLLIGGLQGDADSTARVRNEVAAYESLPRRQRKLRLIAIAHANPDGVALAFPPTGVAYRENPGAHALWRWIGVHAPDLVLIAGEQDFGLAEALSTHAAADVGRIPARQLAATREVRPAAELRALDARTLAPSEARIEMNRRLARSPRGLADELARVYGKSFDQPWYIEAMALIARARLGHLAEVQRLAEPYVDGSKDPLARPSSLVLAGHLIFGELARRTADARYLQLVRQVADLGFEPDGRMKEAMPYHDQYSDSLFMGTAILAQAGALTGERKYFDMAARHIAFMQQLVLRPDGLYRHSPATDAAWGRGNAFPALGLALTLSDFPPDHPRFAQVLESFRRHMAVLAPFQDQDGLWRNVIDHPGAFPEISATAMIGFAMLRGVRAGWLPKKTYQPHIEVAWRAVLARSGANGRFVDACESTARMKSLQDYLHRAALLGPDPRTGAMVMLFATELAGLK